MVDLERAGGLRQGAVHVGVALGEDGVAGVCVGLSEDRVVLTTRRGGFGVERERGCLRPDADVVRVAPDTCGTSVFAVDAVHATGAVDGVAVDVARRSGDALGRSGAVDPRPAAAVEAVGAAAPVDPVRVAGPVDAVPVAERVDADAPGRAGYRDHAVADAVGPDTGVTSLALHPVEVGRGAQHTGSDRAGATHAAGGTRGAGGHALDGGGCRGMHVELVSRSVGADPDQAVLGDSHSFGGMVRFGRGLEDKCSRVLGSEEVIGLHTGVATQLPGRPAVAASAGEASSGPAGSREDRGPADHESPGQSALGLDIAFGRHVWTPRVSAERHPPQRPALPSIHRSANP